MNSSIAAEGAPAFTPLCCSEPLRSPSTRTIRGLTL